MVSRASSGCRHHNGNGGLSACVKVEGITARCDATVPLNAECGLDVGSEARWCDGIRAKCLMCILKASTRMYVVIGWSRAMTTVAAVDVHLGRPRHIFSA